MPAPESLAVQAGRLAIDSTFTFASSGYTDSRLVRAIGRAMRRLEGRTGLILPRASAAAASSTTPGAQLVVHVAEAGAAVQGVDENESYELTVGAGPRQVLLEAPTVVGALRGLETFLQLVEGDTAGWYLPLVTIHDRPRFAWRGLLIDVARHWEPVAVVERNLDAMAAVKLNVFHWHLSDDQGFRVESVRYPRLQEMGSDGQYYTQEQIREIVAYARDRGIRIVPEFDMPGHATSWFVGYPEYASGPGPFTIWRAFGVQDPVFDPTNEATYRFIDGFIGEMAALFPDAYWHVGGDENNGKQWTANQRIQAFMQRRGIKDVAALQTYFNQRLLQILQKHGKKMVGWDEILQPDLPKTSVIQSWRGVASLAAAARQGYSVILSSGYYLDAMASAADLYKVDPLPDSLGLTADQAKNVLGGEACMWAEHVNPETVDSRIWPRLAAIAERFWSPASERDVEDMYRRLSVASIQLERVGLGHEAHSFRMLRLLTGRRGVQPLHDLLAVTMPVTFGQRVRLQGTTQLTPLTRLVDAARPDPWSRAQLNRLAAEVVRDPTGALAARQELLRLFNGWLPLAGQVTALGDTLPLARDGIPAARALRQLADLGIRAIGFLNGGAPSRWKDSTRTTLDELAKPQGLLRLAGVEAVRALVERVP